MQRLDGIAFGAIHKSMPDYMVDELLATIGAETQILRHTLA